MTSASISRTVLVAAPPERVWQAVTDPAELAHWYAPGCPWEIPALRVGALVKFYNTPDDIQTATIASLTPQREFALRWHAGPEAPAAEIVTAFRLEPLEGGTRVTIYESGYDTLPGDVGPALARQAEQGYATSLSALKTQLEGMPA